MTGPSLSASAHGRLDATVDPSVVTAQNRSAFNSRSSQHGMYTSTTNNNNGLGLGYSSHNGRNQSMHSNNSLNGQSSHNSKLERSQGLNQYFIFDWGYPPSEIEKAASHFIEKLTMTSQPSPSKDFLSNRNTDFDLHKSSDPDDPSGPPLCYKISFIKKRSNRDGSAVGPEALFSRHNTSIMMTRSLGYVQCTVMYDMI